MSDTSPKDAVKAVGWINTTSGIKDQFTSNPERAEYWRENSNIVLEVVSSEVLSQMRKQALIKAAEGYEQWPTAMYSGTNIAAALRMLAEE